MMTWREPKGQCLKVGTCSHSHAVPVRLASIYTILHNMSSLLVSGLPSCLWRTLSSGWTRSLRETPFLKVSWMRKRTCLSLFRGSRTKLEVHTQSSTQSSFSGSQELLISLITDSVNFDSLINSAVPVFIYVPFPPFIVHLTVNI